MSKIVFSSASSVYGDTNETMDESHPLAARTWYGASKICGETFLRALSEQTGIEYVILRYMNVYGPRQDAGLVRLVLNRINAGEPPIITGDGSASFDFVHVADVAEANVRAMASDLTDIEFNIGSGTEVSVKDIVGHLLRLTGSDLEPEYRPAPQAAMFRRVGSNARMVELLGWEPEHDIDAGLRTRHRLRGGIGVKVLVTGASGFVAPHLIRALAARGDTGRRQRARRRPHPAGARASSRCRSTWPRRSTTSRCPRSTRSCTSRRPTCPIPSRRSSSTASTPSRRSGCSMPARAPVRAASCTRRREPSTDSVTRPFRESDPVAHHQLYATTKIHSRGARGALRRLARRRRRRCASSRPTGRVRSTA